MRVHLAVAAAAALLGCAVEAQAVVITQTYSGIIRPTSTPDRGGWFSVLDDGWGVSLAGMRYRLALSYEAPATSYLDSAGQRSFVFGTADPPGFVNITLTINGYTRTAIGGVMQHMMLDPGGMLQLWAGPDGRPTDGSYLRPDQPYYLYAELYRSSVWTHPLPVDRPLVLGELSMIALGVMSGIDLYGGIDSIVSTVPAPSGFGALGIGLAGVLAMRRFHPGRKRLPHPA